MIVSYGKKKGMIEVKKQSEGKATRTPGTRELEAPRHRVYQVHFRERTNDNKL